MSGTRLVSSAGKWGKQAGSWEQGLCRKGCHGSGEASYPALLPLLASLPPQAITQDAVLSQTLEAMFQGLPATPPAAASAGQAAFRECLLWGLSLVRLSCVSMLHARLHRSSAASQPLPCGRLHCAQLTGASGSCCLLLTLRVGLHRRMRLTSLSSSC